MVWLFPIHLVMLRAGGLMSVKNQIALNKQFAEKLSEGLSKSQF
jgi:hypothetical protein